MNYTYLLECADHTLYCGWTNDLEKRVKAHNSGLGAKYTKPRRPVKLVYFEEFETKEGKDLLKSLGIEGDYEGIGHCVLGYPLEENPQAAERKKDYVYYVR